MNTDQKRKWVGRKRRAAGWMLLALGVVVAGVWVWSGWNSVSHETRRGWASIGKGCATLVIFGDERAGVDFRGVLVSYLADEGRGWESPNWMWVASNSQSPFRAAHRTIGVAWYEEWDFSKFRLSGGVHYRYSLVLWPIPLLLWTPAALLLRSGIIARRRALKGSCAKCGYPLVGLAQSAPCPECGAVRSGAARVNSGAGSL